MPSFDLTFATAFSGIGGLLDYTLHRLRWRNVGMVENAPAPRAVLAARFPDPPLMGDIRDVHASDFTAVPVVFAFGFPCTGTSSAGHQAGIGDGGHDESRMFWEALRLIDEWDRPEWVVIENPDGVLRSNSGRDWFTVQKEMADRGYGFAYRIVDSNFRGDTPQARPRVILVAHRDGDPAPCLAVLGLTGDGADARAADRVEPGHRSGARPPIADSDAGVGANGELIFRKSAKARAALDAGGYETWVPAEKSNTLAGHDGGRANRQSHLVVYPDGRIRTLTPVEWERLSGFPDDWTAGVMEDKKGQLVPIPDAARMKMCGNCVHLDTGEWIGERLAAQHYAMHGLEAGTVLTA